MCWISSLSQQPTNFISCKPHENGDRDFSNSHVNYVDHLIKVHVWEPLTISQHLVYCGVDTSSDGGDMYFICHVNHKSHAGELSCLFVGESSSQHVTTLKSLVTIGILIVKRKNVSSKKWTLYIRITNKKLSWLNSH